NIAKVDAGDQLLRVHVRQQLPERLVLCLGIEIPDCIDYGSRRQVNGTLFGANPAQLTIPGDPAPETSQVRREALQGLAHQQRLKGIDGHYTNLISPAYGKGEPMALQPH